MRSRWSVLGGVLLAVPGCGAPASPAGAPTGATVEVREPPAAASAAPVADGRFVPDPPLVAMPSEAAVTAERCRVSDVDLGPAHDVVTEGYLYPVASAFGPKGGLFAWMMDAGKVAVRAVTPDGTTAGPMVEGPAWKARPLVLALPESFVLLSVKGSRIDALSVGLDGKPRGAPVSLEVPSPAGMIFDVVRTGDHQITLVTERERPDNGPMSGDEVLVTTLALDGATFRAVQRKVPVHDVFADVRAIPGKIGDEPALLLSASSRKTLTLIRGDKAAPTTAAEVAFDTRRYVEVLPMPGGNNDGYDYGVSTRERWPPLQFEPYPEVSTSRFTLSDSEWLGLDEVAWTGSVFVTARLSGRTAARAKVFVIDCKKR